MRARAQYAVTNSRRDYPPQGSLDGMMLARVQYFKPLFRKAFSEEDDFVLVRLNGGVWHVIDREEPHRLTPIYRYDELDVPSDFLEELWNQRQLLLALEANTDTAQALLAELEAEERRAGVE